MRYSDSALPCFDAKNGSDDLICSGCAQLEMVKVLVKEAHLDLAATNHEGWTPLCCALVWGWVVPARSCLLHCCCSHASRRYRHVVRVDCACGEDL